MSKSELLARLYTVGVLAAAALACPLGADAQVSPDLEPGGPVELVIEKLVGLGLVDDRLAGMRPWSLDEARRMVDLARAAAADEGLEEEAGVWLGHPALSQLAAREFVSGGITMLNLRGAEKPVLNGRGIGEIDAVVLALRPWIGGSVPPPGRSVSTELAGTGTAGPLAWGVRGRAWVGEGAPPPGSFDSEVEQATIYAGLGPFRLGLGRSQSVWGHGREGGTLLAHRARGLDRVTITNESPARPPGFLRYMGPTRGEIFLARLDGDRDIPHATLVGYTLTARPHPVVEATVTALIESGGEGGPSASLGDRIIDHLIIFDWVFEGGPTFLASNKGTSLALRFRVPQWRNTQFFAEHTIEDPARNLVRLFWHHAGWHLGAWVPRLDERGRLDLRMEWHHSGPELHRHSQFTSGRTLGGRIVGLGQPDTEEFLVELGVNDSNGRLTLELGLVDRSADMWRSIIRPTGGVDRIERVIDLPDERWLRAVASLRMYTRGGSEVTVRAGGVRVGNAGFVDDAVDQHRILQLSARVPLMGGR